MFALLRSLFARGPLSPAARRRRALRRRLRRLVAAHESYWRRIRRLGAADRRICLEIIRTRRLLRG